MSTWVIYGLFDPLTESLRYVGATSNHVKRFASHLKDSRRRKTRVGIWVHDLIQSDCLPVIGVLEETSNTEWQAAEKRWIAALKDDGVDLLNSTDGGRGCPGIKFSDEALKKMSEARLGKKLPPFSDAHRKLLSEAAIRRVIASPWIIQKMTEASRGKTHTEKYRQAMDARIGVALPDHHRAAISAGLSGKSKSMEHRLALSRAKINHQFIGVTQRTDTRKWRAYVAAPIELEPNRHRGFFVSGNFATIEEAAYERDKAAWDAYGPNIRLNFPDRFPQHSNDDIKNHTMDPDL